MRPFATAVWLLSISLTLGCAAVDPPAPDAAGAPAPDGPRFRILGTAQDGGFPHAACSCVRCERARTDPDVGRLVASAAIILPGDDAVWLVDASPDIREQLVALRDVRTTAGRVDRSPVDGVLLTHAHLGHYTGLAFFGFEAVHARDVTLVATSAMTRYLSTNGPWSQLIELGNLVPEPLDPTGAATRRLGDGVSVTPLLVPHRDEFADTVAWLVAGPRRTVLYLPDTDGWDAWSELPERVLGEVDVALIDGTFFSLDELPGRDVSSIGHPLIVDSMERFAPLLDGEREIVFTHFNHSNPVLDADGAARSRIEAAGYRVADDGDEWAL